MATAAKKKQVTSKATESNGKNVLELRPIKRCRMRFTIRGTSPLIMHQWSDKAKKLMREKHGGRKTKERDVRNPEQEAQDATYRTDDGDVGIPGMGFKCALISAAHKDLGIEKTLVRKAVFLVTNDSEKILPIECSEPVIREDMVRVGQGSADLRYRPAFAEWSCDITLEVDGEQLKEGDVAALVDRAGFGVGICEWRPEKNGEFGRFEIHPDRPIIWEG